MPEPKSPLTEDQAEKTAPVYSEEEQKYVSAIVMRLMNARIDRDKKHPEFNNMTYLEKFNEEERIANTVIDRTTKEDGITIASGTVEQKMFTVVAEVNRLNLTAQVGVFDKESNELAAVGKALTDVLDKTAELEGDAENKLVRQVELLKHGEVFVQENWVREWKKDKKLTKGQIGKLDAEWSEKLVKAFEGPKRSVLYAPGVYLGNIREFTMKKQPFIYTYKVTSYAEAASRYGMKDKDGKDKWDRWQYVPQKRVHMVSPETISTIEVADGFALSDLQDGLVEEIHYQDRFNNEYQIFLNGIAMLPVGFPLSEISPGGEYNIEKQVLQVINPFFAYGRSFSSKTRELSDLLDEIIRLLILKTRKSIHPPYANVSGKVISSKSLMPGRITMNIDPNALVKIGEEGQGVTAAEYQMLKEMRDAIDRVTVSPQIQGQSGQSGTTAYEVSILQRQAQKVLSLIIFANTLMEQKLGYLRLDNVLANYFTPIDTQFDETKGALKNIFRTTTRKVDIDGRGKGIRKVVPIDDELPSSQEVMDMEDFIGTPEPPQGHRRKTREELGMEPVEVIVLRPDELRKARLFFHVQVEAKPVDTSMNSIMKFREELKDISMMVQFGSQVNPAELEDRFARVHGHRKDKLFLNGAQKAPMPTEGMAVDPNKMNLGNENAAGVSTVGGEDDGMMME